MTALLTCNIGGIDEVIEPVEQIRVHDYFYFTEKNLPYPLPNLGDRLKGKYLKINPHRFLTNYDNFIWMDGRVEVISPDFVSHLTSLLENYDVVIPLHYERQDVFEEISFIKNQMNAGNEYLLARYQNEPFAAEMDFYFSEQYPPHYPLYACTLFARANTPKVNAAFNDWWMRTLEFTCFDQCMFSYIAWKYQLKVRAIPYHEMLQYVSINKHKVVK